MLEMLQRRGGQDDDWQWQQQKGHCQAFDPFYASPTAQAWSQGDPGLPRVDAVATGRRATKRCKATQWVTRASPGLLPPLALPE